METLLKRLFLLSLLITPMTSTAFEVVPANSAESLCYSQAMIGFDSVINSRLGVPPEHALDLAILNQRTVATSERVYSMALLKTSRKTCDTPAKPACIELPRKNPMGLPEQYPHRFFDTD